MIEHRIGDLLAQTDLDAIMQCNSCFGVHGSGVALAIKQKWPQVYEADRKTSVGDVKKLGTIYSVPIILDNARICIHYGIFGQYKFGTEQRQVNYEALYRGLEAAKQDMLSMTRPGNTWFGADTLSLGMPYKMACDRAGGSLEIVEAMLNHLFLNEPNIKLVICKLP